MPPSFNTNRTGNRVTSKKNMLDFLPPMIKEILCGIKTILKIPQTVNQYKNQAIINIRSNVYAVEEPNPQHSRKEPAHSLHAFSTQ